MAATFRVPHVKPLKGPFKPYESLQTQAAINYAVKCATASQKGLGKSDDDTIFNVPNVAEEIDQHAILLTRKIKDGTIAPSFTHLGTFTRLNMLKDCSKDPGTGKTYDVRRHELMNDLSFAGVAFVNVSKENATKTGAIGMFASQHGGTTTVRSMNAVHVRDKKFLPGNVVRWTLPRNPNPDESTPTGWKNPPIEWSMKACERAIFAELEEVTPTNVLQDVYIQYLMNTNSGMTPNNAYTQYDSDLKTNKHDIKLVKDIITAYIQLESRIVGTVVSDDGQGSISMRLR